MFPNRIDASCVFVLGVNRFPFQKQRARNGRCETPEEGREVGLGSPGLIFSSEAGKAAGVLIGRV